MLTTSAAFKNAIASEDREIRAYLKFNGSTILRGVDGLVSIEWDQSVYDEERLCIGCAVSSFITAEFFDNLTGVDFKNSYVEAFLGVVLEDTGTAPSGSIEPDTATVEYVSLGRFDITDSVTKNGKTVITAYDKLSKLSGEYTPSISAGTNGYAIADIVNDVLTQSGVGGSVSGSYGYVQKIQASTYREQLKYCLTMMVQNGSSYILDRTNDTLKMTSVIGQDATQLTITDSTTYMDGMDEQPSFTISSLQATTGTDVYTFGSGQGIEISNPYITNAQASAIYNSMEGFSYLPIRLEFRGNPAIDPGDVLTLTAGGKNTKIVAMRIRSTFNGGFKSTIDCYGNTETYYAMSESPTGTRITQAENMIRLEAARATAAEGNLSAQITINADAISSEVTRATQAEGNLSTRITQNADGVSLVSEKLNNIGGRNYLQYSDDRSTWRRNFPTSYQPAEIALYSNMVGGKKYTVTIWGDVPTRDGADGYYSVYWGGGSTPLGDVYISNGKGSVTFTAPTSGLGIGNAWINIYNTADGGGSSHTFTSNITAVKLEEGEVSTDWSAAPEDKTGNNEIIAKINLSPENITISANKVDLQGYVTFSNLSTSGETAINGGNITTGLIQDQAGKNYWNLNTGEFKITDGSIDINSGSDLSSKISFTAVNTPNNPGTYHLGIYPYQITAQFDGESNYINSIVLMPEAPDITAVYTDKTDNSQRVGTLGPTYLEMRKTGANYALQKQSKLGSDLFAMYGPTTSAYTALIWPDSNGAGRLILGDGSRTLWRTSLTNDGLTFRNSSDAVTASYPASGLMSIGKAFYNANTDRTVLSNRTAAILANVVRADFEGFKGFSVRYSGGYYYSYFVINPSKVQGEMVVLEVSPYGNGEISIFTIDGTNTITLKRTI